MYVSPTREGRARVIGGEAAQDQLLKPSCSEVNWKVVLGDPDSAVGAEEASSLPSATTRRRHRLRDTAPRRVWCLFAGGRSLFAVRGLAAAAATCAGELEQAVHDAKCRSLMLCESTPAKKCR